MMTKQKVIYIRNTNPISYAAIVDLARAHNMSMNEYMNYIIDLLAEDRLMLDALQHVSQVIENNTKALQRFEKLCLFGEIDE